MCEPQATDDPVHRDQEGRFFHGYYDKYCFLPLFIFCGEHLLTALLRPSGIDGAAGALEEVQRIVEQVRQRWPDTRIILRARLLKIAALRTLVPPKVPHSGTIPATKPLVPPKLPLYGTLDVTNRARATKGLSLR